MKEKKEQKKEKVSLVCQGPVQTACSVYANIPSLVWLARIGEEREGHDSHVTGTNAFFGYLSISVPFTKKHILRNKQEIFS